MEVIQNFRTQYSEYSSISRELKKTCLAVLNDEDFKKKFIDKVKADEDEEYSHFNEEKGSYHLDSVTVTLTIDEYAYNCHPILTSEGRWEFRENDVYGCRFDVDDFVGDDLFYLVDDMLDFVED